MPGLRWPTFLKPLVPDTDGVLTRTVFIAKLAKVKKVAGQVNDLYKKKYGDDLTGATGRSVVGVQTWAYVLNRAGINRPEGDSEGLQ